MIGKLVIRKIILFYGKSNVKFWKIKIYVFLHEASLLLLIL